MMRTPGTEQPTAALASTSLTDSERRTVERLVGMLRDELGSNLHAIWLYGSRARGETPHADSDVDLMVIVDSAVGWDPYGAEVIPIVVQAAEAEGTSPAWYSIFVHDPEWLRARREIRSFFVQEVDRDKIVLHGSAME